VISLKLSQIGSKIGVQIPLQLIHKHVAVPTAPILLFISYCSKCYYKPLAVVTFCLSMPCSSILGGGGNIDNTFATGATYTAIKSSVLVLTKVCYVEVHQFLTCSSICFASTRNHAEYLPFNLMFGEKLFSFQC
jgi:hypothetical protein